MITVMMEVANNLEKRKELLKNRGEIWKYNNTPAMGINSGWKI